MKTIALLGFGVISCILGFRSVMAEDLVQENGMVSANTLSLDAQVSKRKFETATFGLG